MNCGRPGCENQLNTGSTYCSRSCAAYDRKRVKELASVNVVSDDKPKIPPKMRNYIISHFGEMADDVLKDAEDIVKLADIPRAVPRPPTRGRTVGGYPPEQSFVLTPGFGLGDYRPDDDVSYNNVELMLQNGQVVFALNLKKAPVRTVFRNENSWEIVSKDKELAEKVEANLQQIFPTVIDEMLSNFEYGVAVGELRWWNRTLDQIGLEGKDTFTALRAIDFCYPATITRFNKTADNKFNGFRQQANMNNVLSGFVDVPRDQSLVLTYDKKFRNLWGRSYLRPVFIYWYWYEIIWRCFLRYLERQATPVVLAKAPQKSKVRLANDETAEAFDHMMVVGADIAKSNVAVVPSDVDPETKQPLYEISYLTSEARTEIFTRALEVLGTQILRAGLLADRVATQESSVGSYNIASVHYIMTRLDDERILDHMLAQLDEFLIQKFGWYNVGPNAPSLHIRTEGLDIEEQQRLFQLLMKLADMKHPELERVDVQSALRIENVPMMSDERFEEYKKEKQKEADEAMKRQQQLMQAKQPGTPFPQKGSQQPSAKEPNRQVDNKPKTPREQALDDLAFIQTAIDMGDLVPVYVTPDELEQLDAHGVGVEYVGE